MQQHPTQSPKFQLMGLPQFKLDPLLTLPVLQLFILSV
ncbi:hypothetical protein DB30_03502 [Enhygromyxa salina]|uniref:Uncharacterized protein n=1 Tax=Enhygromyxa salina TaxID=215803 RepID=A0A0C2CUE5_9BACT|nr:hypothetical protein DB30_03573 [Enhygromyxa salina]KIG11527.1 hypothetical protein DB30_03502 [Enhygromyxa salina]